MFSGITFSHVGARTLLYNREDAPNGATNTRNANMDRPIWFVDAAFCISKHPTSVKNRLHFHTFCIKMAADRQKKQVNLLFCTHLAHFFLKFLAQSK